MITKIRLPSATLLSLGLVFATAGSLLGCTADAANRQPPPFELIGSKCSVMQDFLDALTAHYVDPIRLTKRDDIISEVILDQLTARDIQTVETLFRCFEYGQRPIPGGREFQVKIPVATVNIATTAEKNEFVPFIAHAHIVLRTRGGGSHQATGDYRIEY